jgi:hypothetical protein
LLKPMTITENLSLPRPKKILTRPGGDASFHVIYIAPVVFRLIHQINDKQEIEAGQGEERSGL